MNPCVHKDFVRSNVDTHFVVTGLPAQVSTSEFFLKVSWENCFCAQLQVHSSATQEHHISISAFWFWHLLPSLVHPYRGSVLNLFCFCLNHEHIGSIKEKMRLLDLGQCILSNTGCALCYGPEQPPGKKASQLVSRAIWTSLCYILEVHWENYSSEELGIPSLIVPLFCPMYDNICPSWYGYYMHKLLYSISGCKQYSDSLMRGKLPTAWTSKHPSRSWILQEFPLPTFPMAV